MKHLHQRYNVFNCNFWIDGDESVEVSGSAVGFSDLIGMLDGIFLRQANP
jgi:hypothetical protein